MFDKNLDKYFNEKANNLPFVVDMLNLGDNSTDSIKVDKYENKNLLKDVFEIDDQYKFLTDKYIIDSFQKVFHTPLIPYLYLIYTLIIPYLYFAYTLVIP